jgi:hypothetical protein
MPLPTLASVASLAALLTLAGPAATPAQSAKPAKTEPARAATTATSPDLVDTTGEWRGARWGMSVEDVLQLFPGEAKRLDPELRLPNGTVVAVRLDGQRLLGHPLRGAFLFQDDKLVMVSFRTPEDHNAPAKAYEDAVKFLKGRLGNPRVAAADTNFVDMRHTTWDLPKGVLDFKFIPGVMVLQYHPADLKPERSTTEGFPGQAK